MKIIKFKKMSGSKYKVTLDNTEMIIYEEVILKNNLLRKSEIDIDLLELIMEENKYYEIYDLCLRYINIKMRTKNEIKKYILNKGCDETILDDVIDRLERENILNEEKYISAFINDKIALSKDGPYKIKRSLLDLELNEDLIEKYLNQISNEIWNERLEKIINKRIKMMKNKSIFQIKNKLKEELFSLGYDKDDIEFSLSNITNDETNTLKNEFDKAYKKYQKKYSGEVLNNQIKSYLYRKGFQLDDINVVISENKDF